MSPPEQIRKKKWSDIPFGSRWRTVIARLPRSVPRPVLRITSPLGPYPFSIEVPSRYVDHRVTVWVYLPPLNKLPQQGHNVPIHIDFHGGSFIMGGPFEQAPFCAKLARERGCIVLCVDFCMSPLYEFPAAIEDAEDVLSAVLDSKRETDAGRILHSAIESHRLPRGRVAHGLGRVVSSRKRNYRAASGDKLKNSQYRADPSQLSFSGFSSGGNLALNMVLSAETDDGKIWPCRIPQDVSPIPLILFYPQFDNRQDSWNRPAPDDRGRPGRFGTSLEKRLIPLYIPDHLREEPRASPGLLPLSGFHPKAHFFVVLSELDTLRYQSDEWIRKMREDKNMGSRLKIFRAPGLPHGFANFPERWLRTKAFRIKMEAYAVMDKYWDQVISGKQPDVTDVRGEGNDRTGEGYKGLGVV